MAAPKLSRGRQGAVKALRTPSTRVIAFCLALAAAPALQPAERGLETPKEYRRHIFSLGSFARSVGAATFGQLRNRPPEWGQGARGFIKRFGSSVGTRAIKETIQFGVGTSLHEDLHYYPSNRHGTWTRVEYAVKSTFVVPRTNGPGHTVALGRITGGFGSGLVSRIWQPASVAGIGAGFASGGISIGVDVGMNVAREFWPRKHAKAHKDVK